MKWWGAPALVVILGTGCHSEDTSTSSRPASAIRRPNAMKQPDTPILHRTKTEPSETGGPAEDGKVLDLELLHGKDSFAAHVKVSNSVVIARCIAAIPRFDERDGIVFTDVQLEITRSLTGPSSVGKVISVSVPGGQVNDRQTASPHSAVYDYGQHYVLFLYEDDTKLTLGFDDSRSGRIEAGSVYYDGEVLSPEDLEETLPTFNGG